MAKTPVSVVVDDIAKDFVEEAPREELVARIQGSAAPVADVLRALAHHRDGNLRDWAIQVVGDLVRAGGFDETTGLELIKGRALNDPDSEIRDEATRLFVALAPARAAELIPRLRARLRSKDYFLPVSAMWLLLELGDRDAIPLIQRYRDRMGTDRWQGKQADIVLAVFDRNDYVLAERIASHDHDMMHVLCRAAEALGTSALREALRKCRDGDVDADCRRWCADSLSTVEQKIQG